MENISFVKNESESERESESESESCDLIFRIHEMVMMMKLSSIPFWQLSPISFDHHHPFLLIIKRIIITLSPYMEWWWLILYSVPGALRPKRLIFFKQQSGRFVGFAEQGEWTRWMMMVIYPWWWSWWSGFVSARHFKKPQLAVKWANGGHPTSELQFFVSIQITEKNYIENFIVLSHRSILLTYSLLYLHSVLSQLFTHAGTLQII